jgi:hypothetical protein
VRTCDRSAPTLPLLLQEKPQAAYDNNQKRKSKIEFHIPENPRMACATFDSMLLRGSISVRAAALTTKKAIFITIDHSINIQFIISTESFNAIVICRFFEVTKNINDEV